MTGPRRGQDTRPDQPNGVAVTDWEQTGFDPRLEWAAEGATLLARSCRILVVVDVVRFTTAVEIAVSRGPGWCPGRGRVKGGGAGRVPAERLLDGAFAQLSWPG